MVGVTNDELWQAVGAHLRSIRLRQGFEKPYHLYQERREPAVNTITAIEDGHAATVDAIQTYCRVLGVQLPDVLRQVLGGPAALGADAVAVGRAFETTTNADLRTTLREVAKVAAQQTGRAPWSGQSPDARAATAETATPTPKRRATRR